MDVSLTTLSGVLKTESGLVERYRAGQMLSDSALFLLPVALCAMPGSSAYQPPSTYESFPADCEN